MSKLVLQKENVVRLLVRAGLRTGYNIDGTHGGVIMTDTVLKPHPIGGGGGNPLLDPGNTQPSQHSIPPPCVSLDPACQ
jgi:hypothetical protein